MAAKDPAERKGRGGRKGIQITTVARKGAEGRKGPVRTQKPRRPQRIRRTQRPHRTPAKRFKDGYAAATGLL